MVKGLGKGEWIGSVASAVTAASCLRRRGHTTEGTTCKGCGGNERGPEPTGVAEGGFRMEPPQGQSF